MAKYRKKPIVIEAFQMTLERRWDNSEWPTWLHQAWNRSPGENAIWVDPDVPSIRLAEGLEAPADLLCGTLEGAHRITWDDWIIQGIKGEIYPCKPDIFEATYEPVPMRVEDVPEEIVEIDEDGTVHPQPKGERWRKQKLRE